MAGYEVQKQDFRLHHIETKIKAQENKAHGKLMHIICTLIYSKSKSIAVCETSPHRYGKSLTIRDHNAECYLPPGRGDFPAFTLVEAGTRFSDPEGMQG